MITHRIVAYLISLAVGYFVLTLADKQKNLTKTVGQVIGWVIIAVSLIGPLCVVGSRLYCYSSPANCPSSWYCPYEKGGMKEYPGMKGPDGSGMMKGPGTTEEKGQEK